MRMALVKRWLVGPPMPLAQARHERLGKTVGLAVFASDPLSSQAALAAAAKPSSDVANDARMMRLMWSPPCSPLVIVVRATEPAESRLCARPRRRTIRG